MTLKTIVTQVKYGELAKLAIKDDVDAIVAYTNLGLIALYGRFNLLTKEVLIPLLDSTTQYSLPTDLIVVEAVYNELGEEIPINSDTVDDTVFLPTYNVVEVPFPVEGNTLGVIYSAVPTEVSYTVGDDLALIDVPLPPQLLEPLLYYIGYRGQGSMDGSLKAEAQSHLVRYEQSCKRIEELGLIQREIAPASLNTNESIGE